MTIPKRPIRKKITGLPAFTTVRGGAYFFLPGIRRCATGRLAGSSRTADGGRDYHESKTRSPRTYNQVHVPRPYTPGKRRVSIYWTWSYPWEANRDVTEMDNRFSTMTEVRRVGVAELREHPQYSDADVPAGHRRHARAVLTCRLRQRSSSSSARSRDTRSPVYQRIDQAGQKLPLDERRARRHGHADGVRTRSHGHRAGGRAGRDRGAAAVPRARRHLPDPRARTTTSASRPI